MSECQGQGSQGDLQLPQMAEPARMSMCSVQASCLGTGVRHPRPLPESMTMLQKLHVKRVTNRAGPSRRRGVVAASLPVTLVLLASLGCLKLSSQCHRANTKSGCYDC